MLNRVAGFYSIAVGVLVLGLWAMLLGGGALPEGPVELGFHIFSEVLMALACITAGALALAGAPGARAVTAGAHAMVVYSTLNAAGHYGERGEAGVAVAMTALAILSAVVFALQVRRQPTPCRAPGHDLERRQAEGEPDDR